MDVVIGYITKSGKDEMRKEIDFGIRGLVRDLNKHGYQTLYSCAGHKNYVGVQGKLRSDDEGYISIKGNHNPSDIEKIARKYVKGVVIKKGRLRDPSGKHKTCADTRISFKPKYLQRWGGG